MAVQFQCSQCKQLIQAEKQHFGKVVKCPKCGTNLKVPDAQALSATEQPAGREAGKPADPLIGKQIAHYKIQSLLGQGGMGKVYKAHNLQLDKSCAIKILPPEFARQDATNIERFVREARSAARVEHPNVLPVHFVGKVADNYFIEMQYVDGGTLDGVLSEKGKLDPKEAVRIVRDVADALQAAHEQGIIHRDIKPSNVMLTRRGRALVADFGLAKMGAVTGSLTMTGMIVGTPLYISPEQAEGKRADHRSDIYSLGAMFYQLLTGTPPFTGDSTAAMIYQHVHTPLPDMRQVAPDVPPGLAAVVSRMMEKNPDERYQSCGELIKDLDAALIPRATVAVPVKKKSKAPLLIAAGAVVVLAAVVGVFFLVKTRRREMPDEVVPAKVEPRGLVPRPAVEQSTKITKEATTKAQEPTQVGKPTGKPSPTKVPEPPKTFICTPGKLIFQDEFEGNELKGWRIIMGSATLANGVVALEAGQAAAGQLLRKLNSRNFILQISVKGLSEVSGLQVYVHDQSQPKHGVQCYILGSRRLSLSGGALIGQNPPLLSATDIRCDSPGACIMTLEKIGRDVSVRIGDGRISGTCNEDISPVGTALNLAVRPRSKTAGPVIIDYIRIWEALPKAEEPAQVAKVPVEEPSAEPAKVEALAPPRKPDLVAYYQDIKPVNERIDAYDYESARSRANLLKDKYPELIEMKLSNIDRIGQLRKHCIERVNSGAVKVSMKDVSTRYAFAGPVKKADETGLHAAIKKKWADLEKEEVADFYRKAADPKSADDFIGIAAFLVEGNLADKALDAAMIPLGKAKELGTDVTPYLEYIQTLRKAQAQYTEAERRGKALETAEVRSQEPEVKSTEQEQPQQAQIESYDDVYVATTATGEKIAHPLSRKTHRLIYKGKKIDVPEGMVFIPAGPFLMGEGNDPPNGPQHEVYLDAYFIDKYEVTNAQYMEFVKATGHPMPSYWVANGGKIPEGRENYPVGALSWHDAKAYCDWCGKRLPTEAEWEKAATWDMRRREKHAYPWGDTFDPRRMSTCYQCGCPCDGDFHVHSRWWREWGESPEGKKIRLLGGPIAAVGQFKGDMSPFECFDMAGNVREWVADWYQKDYYKVGPKRNPKGPTDQEVENVTTDGTKLGRCRVQRGGRWDSHPFEPPTSRAPMPPYHGNLLTGFRCAADCPWEPE